MKRIVRLAGVSAAAAALFAVPQAHAQDVRMVSVNGYAVRVQTAGLEAREPGQPVVVFENGGGDPLESWGTIVPRVSAFAPVVAYDRSTVGQSEWDGEIGTPAHVAARLQAVLDDLRAPPPYVLVGWSWGADLVRHHVGLYPDEIAGVVYVDPAADSPAAAIQVLEAVGSGESEHIRNREAIETLFERLSPRAQADNQPQMELYRRRVEHEFAPAPPVPAAVLLAGRYAPPSLQEVEALGEVPYDRREFHEARLRDRIDRLREWVLTAPEGFLVVATNVGHAVQLEDPELVVDAIRRIVFPDPTRQLRQVIEEEGTVALAAAYEALERRYPPEYVNEAVLNRLGYDLLRIGRTADAIAVFAHNVQRYPDASNPHDSLGDAYLAAGATEQAVESYRRSVSLNPNSPSAQKLRQLGRQ